MLFWRSKLLEYSCQSISTSQMVNFFNGWLVIRLPLCIGIANQPDFFFFFFTFSWPHWFPYRKIKNVPIPIEEYEKKKLLVVLWKTTILGSIHVQVMQMQIDSDIVKDKVFNIILVFLSLPIPTLNVFFPPKANLWLLTLSWSSPHGRCSCALLSHNLGYTSL